MTIKKLSAALGLAAFATLLAVPAQAQQAAPAKSACIAPNLAQQGALNWFIGLHPSDDLLSAWCRIQTLPGNVRFNVQWPVSNVHQSWDTSFGGGLPASRIVEIVQSMIPVNDSKKVSDTGVAFGDVLANAVALGAEKTPDGGTVLGFAPTHPASKQIVLWEPLGLRVKPVVLAGQEFTLSVYLKPNLGLLSMALAGKATDVRIKAWTGRFQTGNYFRTACSEFFPECGDLPDVATVHLPLLVDTVRLDAEGENMTAAAVAIGQELYARNAGLTTSNPMEAFDVANGRGQFSINDEAGTLDFKADGNGGTKTLSIVYRASEASALRKGLAKVGDDYRAGTGAKKKAPTVPDSMGRL
ncbi:hypothetical protein OIU34_22480 [Pararhizobium sp. BT-229]|uniref:hypothetical protein n=1 Tax=Pararhizobium sp. BT-229 TaxID=2986923 RepID=UPI0021F6BE8C|nr:hypothetical protein [Pararhizobium sp. BT-229]MCV9964662.1 hypothetical protein [Pararhizobium sp. BT-229]